MNKIVKALFGLSVSALLASCGCSPTEMSVSSSPSSEQGGGTSSSSSDSTGTSSDTSPSTSSDSSASSDTSQSSTQPVVKYTLTFVTGEGASAIDVQTIDAGGKFTRPTDPTKEGYDFDGWYKEDTYQNAFDFNAEVTGNVTIYARWNAKAVPPVEYTITFDSKGGSAVAVQTIEAGEKFSIPDDPTKEGYDFAGWYKEEAYENEFDFNAEVTASVTVYAKWTEKAAPAAKYTLTFVTGEGASTVEAQTINEGEKFVKPTDPTKEGYDFAGWYQDAQYQSEFDFTADVTANATVYAKWNEKAAPAVQYTLTFDSKGGSAVTAQTIDAGGKFTRPTDPTKEGYDFAGWYKEDTYQNEFDFNAEVTASVTVYAKWTEKATPAVKYTLTFDSKGGSAVTAQTIDAGGKFTKPTDPTKEGYDFAGWYKEEAYENEFDFNAEVTASVTIYAKWTEKATPAVQYTLTFVTGEGASTVEAQTINEGEKFTKPTDPTKEGYDFAGWYKEEAYENEFDFNAEVTASVTVYAKWTESVAPVEEEYSYAFISGESLRIDFKDVTEETGDNPEDLEVWPEEARGENAKRFVINEQIKLAENQTFTIDVFDENGGLVNPISFESSHVAQFDSEGNPIDVIQIGENGEMTIKSEGKYAVALYSFASEGQTVYGLYVIDISEMVFLRLIINGEAAYAALSPLDDYFVARSVELKVNDVLAFKDADKDYPVTISEEITEGIIDENGKILQAGSYDIFVTPGDEGGVLNLVKVPVMSYAINGGEDIPLYRNEEVTSSVEFLAWNQPLDKDDVITFKKDGEAYVPSQIRGNVAVINCETGAILANGYYDIFIDVTEGQENGLWVDGHVFEGDFAVGHHAPGADDFELVAMTKSKNVPEGYIDQYECTVTLEALEDLVLFNDDYPLDYYLEKREGPGLNFISDAAIVEHGAVYTFYLKQKASGMFDVWIDVDPWATVTLENLSGAIDETKLEFEEVELTPEDIANKIDRKITATADVLAGQYIYIGYREAEDYDLSLNTLAKLSTDKNNIVREDGMESVISDAEGATLTIELYHSGEIVLHLDGLNYQEDEESQQKDFYFVSNSNGWHNHLTGFGFEETENQGEYILEGIALSAGDEFKVQSKDGEGYYPAGATPNHVIAKDGLYDIYFRPAGKAEWGEEGDNFINVRYHVNLIVTKDGDQIFPENIKDEVSTDYAKYEIELSAGETIIISDGQRTLAYDYGEGYFTATRDGVHTFYVNWDLVLYVAQPVIEGYSAKVGDSDYYPIVNYKPQGVTENEAWLGINLSKGETVSLQLNGVDLHFYHYDTEEHDDGIVFTAPSDGAFMFYHNSDGKVWPAQIEHEFMVELDSEQAAAAEGKSIFIAGTFAGSGDEAWGPENWIKLEQDENIYSIDVASVISETGIYKFKYIIANDDKSEPDWTILNANDRNIYYEVEKLEVALMVDGSAVDVIEVAKGHAIDSEPVAPEKEGHDFIGWFDAPEDGNKLEAWPMVIDESMAIFARYSVNTYTIHYNGNGAEGNMADTVFTYDGEEHYLTENAFALTGYHFDMWNTEADGSGDGYADLSGLYFLDKDELNLYAMWEANTYTVVFHNNLPDTDDETVEQEFIYGDDPVALTANDFAKAGLNFVHWTTKADGTGTIYEDGQMVSNLVVSGSLDLYAQWTEDYVLTFNTEGGSAIVSQAVPTDGTLFVRPAENPTKTGYAFENWYKEEACQNLFDFSIKPSGSTIAYANWTAIGYKVRFNPNGGSGSMGDEDFTYDAAKLLSENLFSRGGYEFEGWALAADGAIAYEDGESVSNLASTQDAIVTLYAKWAAHPYDISYNNIEGATNPQSNPATYTIEGQDIVLANAEKDGYTFLGWYDAEEGGNKITTIAHDHKADVTLYAHWEQIMVYKIVGSLVGTWDYNNVAAQTITVVDGVGRIEIVAPAGDDTEFGIKDNNAVWYGLNTHEGGNVTTNAGIKYVIEFYPNRKGGEGDDKNNFIVIHEWTPVIAQMTGKIGESNLDFAECGDPQYAGQVKAIVNANANDILTFKYNGESIDVIVEDVDGNKATLDGEDIKITETGEMNIYFKAYKDGTFGVYVAPNFGVGIYVRGDAALGWGDAGCVTSTALKEPDDENNIGQLLGVALAVGDFKLAYLNWSEGTWSWTKPNEGSRVIGGAGSDSNYFVQGQSNDNIHCKVAGLYNIYLTKNGYISIEKVVYSMTFNSNGGSEVAQINVHAGTGAKFVEPSDPEKAGYTFGGWFTDQECTEAYVWKSTPNASLTVYAKWTAHPYHIYYHNIEGATNPQSNPAQYTIEGQDIVLADAAKNGYTFVGWYDAEEAGNKITTIAHDHKADVTLYARWSVINYNITYYLNGGSVASPNPATYNVETTTFTLINPTKVGYSFAGWKLDNKGVLMTTVTIAKGSTIGEKSYYAYWVDAYSVTYHGNGHTGGSVPEEQVDIANGTECEVASVGTLVKIGYSFDGWNTTEDGKGTDYSAGALVVFNANTDLYAKWRANAYTVNFVVEEGETVDPTSKSVTFDSTYGVLPIATKDGYAFAGWFTSRDNGTEVTSETSVAIVEDQNLYPHWNKISTVTLTVNGGKINEGDVSSYVESKGTVLPTNVTKDYYTFAGWFDNVGLNGDPVTTITAQATGNQTFWAKWTPNVVTVTYNANGGTGAMADSQKSYGAAGYTELSSNTYNKTNYHFKEWNTQADGNGTKYEALSDSDFASSNSLPLFAIWEADFVYGLSIDGGQAIGLTENDSPTYEEHKIAEYYLNPSRDFLHGQTLQIVTPNSVAIGSYVAVEGNTTGVDGNGAITIHNDFNGTLYFKIYQENEADPYFKVWIDGWAAETRVIKFSDETPDLPLTFDNKGDANPANDEFGCSLIYLQDDKSFIIYSNTQGILTHEVENTSFGNEATFLSFFDYEDGLFTAKQDSVFAIYSKNESVYLGANVAVSNVGNSESTFYAYAFTGNEKNNGEFPGVELNYDAGSGLYYAFLGDAAYSNIIFSDGGTKTTDLAFSGLIYDYESICDNLIGVTNLKYKGASNSWTLAEMTLVFGDGLGYRIQQSFGSSTGFGFMIGEQWVSRNSNDNRNVFDYWIPTATSNNSDFYGQSYKQVYVCYRPIDNTVRLVWIADIPNE